MPAVEALDRRLEDQIEEGVALLRRGGIVAYPTDTLYGLGVDAFCEEAVERVFIVKGRPQGMPLPLLLGDARELHRVTDTRTPMLETLAKQFWPGPLTLVVPAGALVPALVTARGWTVAVRVPDHPIARELARRLGGPITGTSANRSGGPDPHTADAVRRQIGRHVDRVIQGGPAPVGRASTVLDITGPVPRLLREGAISEAAILEACSNLTGRSKLGVPAQE